MYNSTIILEISAQFLIGLFFSFYIMIGLDFCVLIVTIIITVLIVPIVVFVN